MEIQIIDRFTDEFVSKDEIGKIIPRLRLIHRSLIEHTGEGSDFHGWLDLPLRMENDGIFWEKLDKLSCEWKSKLITHIVVVGIGGSYLGTKAIYEVLKLPFSRTDMPELIFAGHHMSASYLDDLCHFLMDKSFGVVVISKSGTTLEPALAFRILRQLLIDQFGEIESNHRIISITDSEKGALRAMTNESEWPSFIIEDSVGGRYSVLSPVGIVPLAMAGIDVRSLLNGASLMQKLCVTQDTYEKNIALHYAAIRYVLLKSGKMVEILASFQPEMQYFIEWWKQLFGESDGKQKNGIFPAGVVFSTDLHSMGQYIQDGLRIIFETFIIVRNKPGNMLFPGSVKNEDGLNYLNGRKVTEVNSLAEQATMLAHYEGQVPVIGISVPDLSETSLGGLVYFFEFACAIGGYLLEINPFDQPGVEAYKKNMFALMGKPGMEKMTEEILKKLKTKDA